MRKVILHKTKDCSGTKDCGCGCTHDAGLTHRPLITRPLTRASEGYKAAQAGKPRSANPYPQGSESATSWATGHSEFHTDKREGKAVHDEMFTPYDSELAKHAAGAEARKLVAPKSKSKNIHIWLE